MPNISFFTSINRNDSKIYTNKLLFYKKKLTFAFDNIVPIALLTAGALMRRCLTEYFTPKIFEKNHIM